MTPICFVDTETDGVHPGRKPWEIALIRRDENGEQELSFFVEIDLSTADPFGLKIGGFYDRHPVGRWLSKAIVGTECPTPNMANGLYSPQDAARLVTRMTHGAHLVGAVPNFDTEVFDKLLRAHGLAPSWHYHLIDVEALAVGYVMALKPDESPGIELPWKSTALMEAIGVETPPEEERHTALGDARWAMAAYDAVMRTSS
jgi:hypothetical protein